jgi:hypothetical protein
MNTADRFFFLIARSNARLPDDREDDHGTNDRNNQRSKRPTRDGVQTN